jgi:protein TonB
VEIEVPEYDPRSTSDLFYGIPDAPPGEGIVGGPPMRLGGDIVPPVKVSYPQPRYTEEGRLSRIQGVVILEAIIDAVGDVHDVKVLKGLPMGLSESAVETAMAWKFKPATLNGRPVPVYLNLTIHFSLQ